MQKKNEHREETGRQPWIKSLDTRYREERAACGACDSCALRLRAFREAGVADPIPYLTNPGDRR